jgi:hypothetical protein
VKVTVINVRQFVKKKNHTKMMQEKYKSPILAGYCISCTSRNEKVKFLHISCISCAFSLPFLDQEICLFSMTECLQELTASLESGYICLHERNTWINFIIKTKTLLV